MHPHSLFSSGTMQRGQPSCPRCPHPGAHRFSNTPTSSPSRFGGSASIGIYCQLTLGHCLGERLGLQGQLVGSQPLTFALLFPARGCSPQPQFPALHHPIPEQPPPCPLSGRQQVFRSPLLPSPLPTPEETTTNPCVSPAQTQPPSRTHHRQHLLGFLTVPAHNTPQPVLLHHQEQPSLR